MRDALLWMETYEILVGVTAAIGAGYLLYLQRSNGGFDRFVYALLAGFLLFTLGGPITNILAPDWVHVIHGVAALFAVFALYSPVHNDLRHDEWASLILQEPRMARDPADWMTPMDDDVLELFDSTDLVLTPAVIAENLEYSRGEVNRHLSALEDHGLVEKVDRGKYRLTSDGEAYLRGETPTTD
ncbi:MAG: helix-turn-helix domain-containing protein [Halobacteriaceae archaeon]